MERIDRQVGQISDLARGLENERSYRGIERLVQLIIQALLDLGLMVIAAVGGRTPKGYSEVGELLSDLGALDKADARLLRSMAGMRNVPVHAYATIERGAITSSSRDLVNDAPRMARALRHSLEGKALDPPATALAKALGHVFKGRVKAALLFGGRAKGYLVKGDYDIAVYFGGPYSLYDLGELTVDVAEALEVRDDQVDLLSLDSAAPEMVLEALKGEPIYVEDPYIIFEFRLRAMMELLDLRSAVKACTS